MFSSAGVLASFGVNTNAAPQQALNIKFAHQIGADRPVFYALCIICGN
jgi:hypothetical protein